MLEKLQIMCLPRTPTDRKGKMRAWPFSRLWRVSSPTLFQMTVVATLLATVLGDCGPPPYLHDASPVNELNETNFETGTVLKYNCRPGYSKTASKNQLICGEGGQWLKNSFCVKRQCSNPGELRNGQVIIKTDFTFGSHIEFKCLEGYFLVGSTTSYCEIQDRTVGWSHPFPVCVIAMCQPPPVISNGKLNAGNEEAYTYGASVSYRCDPGFSMLGQASISCTVENNTETVWSPSPPTCKKVTCLQPNVEYGRVVSGFGPTYTYKESISFECLRGYSLKGSRVIHCQADNNWDPPPPTCELSSCTNLPEIPHSSWETYQFRRPTKYEVYDVGTVLTYYCLPGYKPAGDGPMTITCQSNFKWSPYAECVERCCPKPDLRNGRIIRHKIKTHDRNCEYFYGDSISYSCFGEGSNEATCQANGKWTTGTPVCDESCRNPPTIAHGHYKKTSYIFQTVEYKYECDKGYTLVGQPTLSCSNSHWSGPAPQCKALCLKPEIGHGKLLEEKNRYVESENITIQCDDGYEVVGSQNITCIEDSTWYPKVPKCEWVFPEGCEQVRAGTKLMQCRQRPEDVKMALELYKLSLEIEKLEREKDREKKYNMEL